MSSSGSSSSSDNEAEVFPEYGLKAYLYEPTKSKNFVRYSNAPSTCSTTSSSDDDENQNENTRIGNVSWCLCEKCKAMESSIGSLCCKEMSEISEDRLWRYVN